jgi:hypothetical protein
VKASIYYDKNTNLWNNRNVSPLVNNVNLRRALEILCYSYHEEISSTGMIYVSPINIFCLIPFILD